MIQLLLAILLPATLCHSLALTLSPEKIDAKHDQATTAVDAADKAPFKPLDPKDFPKSAQKIIKAHPSGAQPKYTFSAPDFPTPAPTAIAFYTETNCAGHGGGEVYIQAKNFLGATLCPHGDGGDGGNDDVDWSGASFIVDGEMGTAQINMFSNPGCNDRDWVGYVTGRQLSLGEDAGSRCFKPKDMKGKEITGFESFNLLTPD